MSNSSGLVSVIMNCFNGEKYLREAIDSAISQTYQNLEIILWDNRSTDKSSSIVKSYADSRIKYFLADEFTSLGEARNLAIKKSKGEFIAFLDVDDIWFATKMEKQVALFNDPKVGIVISDTIFFNEKGDFKQLYKNEKPPVGEVFAELLKSYCVSLETIAVRKSYLDQMDYWFDSRFSMIEEMDFLLRLSKISQLAYVDEPLAKWRMHNQSWTYEKRSLFPVERKQMIETYSKIIPDFRNTYSESIQSILKLAALEESIVFFQKGEIAEMRSKIEPFILKDKKYLVLYLLSFMPKGMVRSVLTKRGILV
ncbi:MAG: glycosyltransferase [Bacteriovorax sp.]|nr:glycosyltransferase [Bacteriovorax sp.]